MTARNPGAVMIYSATGIIPVEFREAVDGRLEKVAVRDPTLWARTDFYVTTAALSVRVERAAARMSAVPIVLPEGLNYLLSRIDSRCFSGADVWIFLPGRAGDAL